MRRVIAALIAAAHLSACTSWWVETLTPARVVAERRPTALRLTRADSSRITLYQPRATADSLIGVRGSDGDRPVGVALADVTRVETRRFDPGKTIGLVLGLGAVVGAALLIAVAQSFGEW